MVLARSLVGRCVKSQPLRPQWSSLEIRRRGLVSSHVRFYTRTCAPFPTSSKALGCQKPVTKRHNSKSASSLAQSSHKAFAPATCKLQTLVEKTPVGEAILLHGYLANWRVASSKLGFAQLLSIDLTHSIQLVASSKESPASLACLQSCDSYIPVCIKGIVTTRDASKAAAKGVDDSDLIRDREIIVQECKVLNSFPKDDITLVKNKIVPGSDQRYLQLRTDKVLRSALVFRGNVVRSIRNFLCGDQDFLEVETPILFKSTPEGAREFLVPTRTPGQAYALPQSPQQFKQLLMASGIPRYMQIAKCFRDEDQRADRQPEFTQVDLEMAFANSEDVMSVIESLVKTLWSKHLAHDIDGNLVRMTYEDAMSTYGSDKPDRRLGSTIHRIDHMIPVDLIRKISNLDDPIVEVLKLPLAEAGPAGARRFVSDFMSSPLAQPFNDNPAGEPGIFIFDAGKPLSGLQPFGFEAAEHLDDLLDLSHGDVVVIQARENKSHDGSGSTPLGNLRLAMHSAAQDADLLPRPTGWDFLWVTDFPLFTPIESAPSSTTEPNTSHEQLSGRALKSTHHPFTAPSSEVDLLKLDTTTSSDRDALTSIRAAHYDLVLNGTEIGGGSVRIHNAEIQRHVLTHILGLAPDRVERDFGHLLRALRSGCPPHAGFALGLDRLLALVLGRESVRDVIAFPKGKEGRDYTVGAPNRVSADAWSVYHLQSKD